jgi:hypothetical protein
MIVTKKVEATDNSIEKKNHKYSALDKPVVVNLTWNGTEWIGKTYKLKAGMYQCELEYLLKY